MPFLIGLLLVFVVLLIAIALTVKLVGLVVTLVVAALIGWLAEQVVPGSIPYGWLGAIVAGLLGSWLGTLLLGGIPPHIAGIAIIPAIVGAIILAFVAKLVLKSTQGGSRRL